MTNGHGSKAAGLAMAFKLIESAQRRWRMVNAPRLVALVRAGAPALLRIMARAAAEFGRADRLTGRDRQLPRPHDPAALSW
jgi:hypothetical protein